jgi:hypothetical protein
MQYGAITFCGDKNIFCDRQNHFARRCPDCDRQRRDMQIVNFAF